MNRISVITLLLSFFAGISLHGMEEGSRFNKELSSIQKQIKLANSNKNQLGMLINQKWHLLSSNEKKEVAEIVIDKKSVEYLLLLITKDCFDSKLKIKMQNILDKIDPQDMPIKNKNEQINNPFFQQDDDTPEEKKGSRGWSKEEKEPTPEEQFQEMLKKLKDKIDDVEEGAVLVDKSKLEEIYNVANNKDLQKLFKLQHDSKFQTDQYTNVLSQIIEFLLSNKLVKETISNSEVKKKEDFDFQDKEDYDLQKAIQESLAQTQISQEISDKNGKVQEGYKGSTKITNQNQNNQQEQNNSSNNQSIQTNNNALYGSIVTGALIGIFLAWLSKK